MKKKVVIIGGGVAGLCAGVYAQKCGFEVTVLESHSIAGGVCTSWKRKGYLFEGGMHWLTGSGPKEPINAAWRHVGALDNSVEIHCAEPFMAYDHAGTPIRIYRDAEETEKHLLALSPEDAEEIKKLMKHVRKMKNISMPITDLRGVKVTKKMRLPLSMMFSFLSSLHSMNVLSNTSCEQYTNRFTHEGVRNLIRSSTWNGVNILPLVFTMGTLARGDGGFPEGGSLPFVMRIVKTFEGVGGKILYSTKADRVIVEGGKAVGVMAGGNRLAADSVIIASDTMLADRLFDTPPKAAWLEEMRSASKPTMCTFISLGINADLKKYPKNYVIRLETQIKLADKIYEYLGINNYSADPVYSPEGKTAATVTLDGDTYDFWEKAKKEGRYEEEKQRIAGEVIAAITAHVPEADGEVEVCDVATPLTYERYCGSWKGSWMTEMVPGGKMDNYPATIKGLSGVYFAGHRMIPPGGLPGALMSGRAAVQHLCRDTNTLFVSEE